MIAIIFSSKQEEIPSGMLLHLEWLERLYQALHLSQYLDGLKVHNLVIYRSFLVILWAILSYVMSYFLFITNLI